LNSTEPQARAFEQECVALSTKVPASEVTSIINIIVVVAVIVIVFPDMSLPASYFCPPSCHRSCAQVDECVSRFNTWLAQLQGEAQSMSTQ
jgi:hypothetical protein